MTRRAEHELKKQAMIAQITEVVGLCVEHRQSIHYALENTKNDYSERLKYFLQVLSSTVCACMCLYVLCIVVCIVVCIVACIVLCIVVYICMYSLPNPPTHHAIRSDNMKGEGQGPSDQLSPQTNDAYNQRYSSAYTARQSFVPMDLPPPATYSRGSHLQQSSSQYGGTGHNPTSGSSTKSSSSFLYSSDGYSIQPYPFSSTVKPMSNPMATQTREANPHTNPHTHVQSTIQNNTSPHHTHNTRQSATPTAVPIDPVSGSKSGSGSSKKLTHKSRGSTLGPLSFSSSNTSSPIASRTRRRSGSGGQGRQGRQGGEWAGRDDGSLADISPIHTVVGTVLIIANTPYFTLS
jgi:hypothetical protein